MSISYDIQRSEMLRSHSLRALERLSCFQRSQAIPRGFRNDSADQTDMGRFAQTVDKRTSAWDPPVLIVISSLSSSLNAAIVLLYISILPPALYSWSMSTLRPSRTFYGLETFMFRCLLDSLSSSSGSPSLPLLLHFHLQNAHATLQIVLLPLDRVLQLVQILLNEFDLGRVESDGLLSGLRKQRQ